MSPKGVGAFLQAVTSLRIPVILTVCYAVASRVFESVHLKSAAIDSHRMVIYVDAGMGAKDRHVMLSPRSLEILRDCWKITPPSEWLFPGDRPGEQIPKFAVEHGCEEARERSRVTRSITLHSVPHAFAVSLLRAETDQCTVQLLLGHRSLSTTGQYLQIVTSQVCNRQSTGSVARDAIRGVKSYARLTGCFVPRTAGRDGSGPPFRRGISRTARRIAVRRARSRHNRDRELPARRRWAGISNVATIATVHGSGTTRVKIAIARSARASHLPNGELIVSRNCSTCPTSARCLRCRRRSWSKRSRARPWSTVSRSRRRRRCCERSPLPTPLGRGDRLAGRAAHLGPVPSTPTAHPLPGLRWWDRALRRPGANAPRILLPTHGVVVDISRPVPALPGERVAGAEHCFSVHRHLQHRLLSVKNGRIRFRRKYYLDGNRQKIMALEAREFIRRFLIHVLPSGFHRIRYYGFLCNSHCAGKLRAARDVVGRSSQSTRQLARPFRSLTGRSMREYPHFRTGVMVVIGPIARISVCQSIPDSS